MKCGLKTIYLKLKCEKFRYLYLYGKSFEWGLSGGKKILMGVSICKWGSKKLKMQSYRIIEKYQNVQITIYVT